MSRSLLSIAGLLTLGACRCGEPAAGPTPAPAAAEASGAHPRVRSDLKLSARCDKLLAVSDVESVCGTDGLTVAEGDGWQYECELRFTVGEDKQRRLSLRVANELDSASALRALERGATEAQQNKKYTKLEGVGVAGHTYLRTFGKGEGFRRMPVLETVDGPFAVKLEAAYHPQSQPVCTPEQLPELAKRVLAGLKALEGGGQPAAPAPAAPAAQAEGEPKPEGEPEAEGEPNDEPEALEEQPAAPP